jgi:hypothetical protein
MKVVFIPLLVLSNLFVASAAVAKDTKEALRDHLTFCSQIIINDPDPSIAFNHMRDCCAFQPTHSRLPNVRLGHHRALVEGMLAPGAVAAGLIDARLGWRLAILFDAGYGNSSELA